MSAALASHRVRSAPAVREICWLMAGLAIGFLVPFVLADTLHLARDLYYGFYALTVAVFFGLWARGTASSIAAMTRRHWKIAAVLGLVCAAALAVVVVRSERASNAPSGLAFVGALMWRGVVYGVADGVLLSAFPILAVFAAMNPTGRHPLRTLATGIVALCASLLMTATYHLGYSDFRSTKLAKPLAGDIVWSLPTLVTLNPLGAAISHAGLHVAAVAHSYDTDVFLPPHR